jgi:hypothetical protein
MSKEEKPASELEVMICYRLGENIGLQVRADRLVDWVANVQGPPEMVLKHQMQVDSIAGRLRRRFGLKKN